MLFKKILIIFLSLMLAVSCSSKLEPVAQDFSQENGGGHLNDFGNGDLIENGDSSEGAIASFINKYAGVYYESGKVTYKLYNGKLYQNESWIWTEITNGIIVEPNGNKMQISNRPTKGYAGEIMGTIEVLNFRKEGDDKDGFSRHHLNILERDTSKVEVMNKIATYSDLGKYKGTFKELSGSAFLSIDDDGTVYFKEAVKSSYFGMKDGDLWIIGSDNTKNVIKFKEGNFVYKKYSRTDEDTSVDSSSVTRDFIESLGEVQYKYGDMYIEFNRFDPNSAISSKNDEAYQAYPGGVKISQNKLISRVAKRAILKGKTLTVFDGGNRKKIDWTLTFNDDNSVATYSKDGVKLDLTKINN